MFCVLCSSPILKNPDFDRLFIVQTDRGIGAVLSQLSDEGSEHPVAYYSRKRYSTVEKECLAFKVYLLGGKPFTVLTDHRSLEWLNRLNDTNARLTRWSLELQSYSFTVRHRAGRANANADRLSRAHNPNATTLSPEKDGGV